MKLLPARMLGAKVVQVRSIESRGMKFDRISALRRIKRLPRQVIGDSPFAGDIDVTRVPLIWPGLGTSASPIFNLERRGELR